MDKEKKYNMNPTFDDVTRIDKSLQFLAAYEVTGGMMVVPKSPEELTSLTVRMADKFNYFKTQIQKGECTFDFIKNTVLTKNGPFPQTQTNIDSIMPSDIDELAVQEVANPIRDNQSLIEHLVKSLFPNGQTEITKQTLPDGSEIHKIEIPLKPKQIEQKIPKKKRKRKS